MSDTKETGMSPEELARRVHSMVRAYVGQKIKNRCGKTWDDFKASEYRDAGYRDAANKVCMDAFLAMRSRKEHREFLAYWTGTICSVPQFIQEAEFEEISLVLLDPDRWEDVKSLAMLALSAHSIADVKSQSAANKSETIN